MTEYWSCDLCDDEFYRWEGRIENIPHLTILNGNHYLGGDTEYASNKKQFCEKCTERIYKKLEELKTSIQNKENVN